MTYIEIYDRASHKEIFSYITEDFVTIPRAGESITLEDERDGRFYECKVVEVGHKYIFAEESNSPDHEITVIVDVLCKDQIT